MALLVLPFHASIMRTIYESSSGLFKLPSSKCKVNPRQPLALAVLIEEPTLTGKTLAVLMW